VANTYRKLGLSGCCAGPAASRAHAQGIT
jgi:hypothetical protein